MMTTRDTAAAARLCVEIKLICPECDKKQLRFGGLRPMRIGRRRPFVRALFYTVLDDFCLEAVDAFGFILDAA